MAITKLVADSITSGAIANTPAFLANPSTNYSISGETQTKITLDTEVYDTHSAFSSSKFTIPSGQNGKYNFYWNVSIAAGDNNLYRLHSILYKNGYVHFYGGYTDWSNQAYRNLDNRNGSVVVSASAGDYFEIYAYIQGGGSPVYIGYSGAVNGVYAPVSYFGGYKIIE